MELRNQHIIKETCRGHRMQEKPSVVKSLGACQPVQSQDADYRIVDDWLFL